MTQRPAAEKEPAEKPALKEPASHRDKPMTTDKYDQTEHIEQTISDQASVIQRLINSQTEEIERIAIQEAKINELQNKMEQILKSKTIQKSNEQENEMNEMREKIKKIEELIDSHRMEDQFPSLPQPTGNQANMITRKKVPIKTPIINWENQEEVPEQETSGVDLKKYDWTQVKSVRKWKGPRPILSESMNEKVNEGLEKHIEDKYRQEIKPKTKPQKQMTNDQRKKTIQNMLAKQGLQLGIGPHNKRPCFKGTEKH